jgi:hypothetical protein
MCSCIWTLRLNVWWHWLQEKGLESVWAQRWWAVMELLLAKTFPHVGQIKRLMARCTVSM